MSKFKQTETCGERSPEQGEGRSRTIGGVPEGWELRELESLGRVVTGKTPPTKDVDNFGEGYPFITPRDMIGQKYIRITERYVTEKGKDVVKGCFLPMDSVCVSCIGSDMGKVVMTDRPSITNQQLNSLVCEQVEPHFVYYGIINITDKLRDAAFHSTAVPILNKSAFSRFEILIPRKKSEQRAIAKILSDLDQKIELNRQMNKALESIAQAIFKRWFVDFEFPDERGKPYKSSGGKMVDSELGEIPEGWEVKSLRNIISELESGRRPKGGAAIEGIPSIGAENVNGLGNYDYASTKYVGDDFFKQMKTGIVMDYDILLYKDGAYIGKKTMVGRGFPFYKCCVNEHVFILRAQPPIGQFYLYFYLDQPSITEQIKQLNTNSAQPGLNRESLGGLEILIPDQRLLVNFTKIAQSIIEIILNNSIENKELANIRDSLLPRLMSGRIRINNV